MDNTPAVTKKSRVYLWAVKPNQSVPVLGGDLNRAFKAARPIAKRATAVLEAHMREKRASEVAARIAKEKAAVGAR